MDESGEGNEMGRGQVFSVAGVEGDHSLRGWSLRGLELGAVTMVVRPGLFILRTR